MLETIQELDKSVFLYLNGIHTTFWDYTMTIFTLTPTWILFYLVILVVITKKYGRKALPIFLSIIVIILLSDQISGLIKDSVERLRPTNDPEVSPFTHIFFRKGGMYGFVSSHAANAFTFAIFSSLLFRNSLYTIFILVWATLIGYTRIYLGVHYPGDVLGGALLGALIGWGVFQLLLAFESRMMPVRPIAKNRLNAQEALIVVVSGAALAAVTMSTVALMLKNGLLI